MRIVQPSAVLEFHTPDPLKFIELAGRTCYKSEDLITDESADKFVRMIIKRGHDSVLEHASAGYRIICDRGVSHEIVRHRIASYSQESTRYCNYSKDKFGDEITLIRPPRLSEIELFWWEKAMKQAEDSYLAMLDNGASPQIARSVLPNSLKTEIVMTTNFREWRHFIRLRCSKAAHPQMQEVAKLIANDLWTRWPAAFDDVISDLLVEDVATQIRSGK